MRRWFLSYTSQDTALTQRLKDALKRKDSDSEIFFAPEGMRAGGFWKPQLAKEIEESTAFILLVGEKGLGDWQVMEYYEALDRRAKEPDYPIILILSAQRPAPGLPFARQLHWVTTEDPASEATIGKLFDATSGPAQRPGELWRFTRPYRGLEAMTEANSDYFFGRDHKTVEVIDALSSMPGRLPILLGNSGVGKSSLAQAGVLAALLRQGWSEKIKEAPSWPEAFHDSRQWCFLTLRPGTQPLQSLVALFFDTWQYTAASAERVKEEKGWTELLRDGKAALPDLLNATERRFKEMAQTTPPAFFLYIDQGEELYVRAEERERRRFSEILAQSLGDRRLRALMSMRSDFLGELQSDELLFDVRRQIDVPPLREPELREVVSRPAKLLSARFETDDFATMIARRTAEESTKDAGALPLLSYLLDDMWTQMVERGDGVLRLPEQAFELGRVLVRRANAFVSAHPDSEEQLRRVFTLKLATVREGEEPTRRRASRSEFSDEEWRLVSELADHPNRLLVTARLEADTTSLAPQTAKPDSNGTPASRETYAEVAHEAIFRRWDKLREWIAVEREFLAWKTGLEAARRAWQATPERSSSDALLMGLALAQAKNWLTKRHEDLSVADRRFIDQSAERERKTRARARRVQMLVYVLLVGIIVGLIGVINEAYVKEQWRWYMVTRPYMQVQVRPYVLSAVAEQALKPKDTFKECASEQGKDYCPEMVVVPAGSFVMGSPLTEKGRDASEGPQHTVTIAKPFAVAKFELTFDEWDTCVAYGDCPQGVSDAGFGRGQRPVIFVTWDDAQRYAAWLSKMTGKPYRLLTEAEYEYATRAGGQTAYPWGDDIGRNNANCNGCGSEWDARQTALVGSFKPNAFGLYDLVGNVFEWVEDCAHNNYDGAPTDGSAWTEGGDCIHIDRGGAWNFTPSALRSASRDSSATSYRIDNLGIRVGRTLIAP
jgi:formylglycine-generating enzyme required for sulfatase activity